MNIKILTAIATLVLAACGDTSTEYIEREYPCDLYRWNDDNGPESPPYEWVQVNDLREGENLQPLDFCGYAGEDFSDLRAPQETDFSVRCQAPGGIVTACFLDY